MPSLSYRMDLAFARDQVWEEWTTARGLAGWLCPRARIDPVVGGAIELGWSSDGACPPPVTGRVLSLFRPRCLVWSWPTPSGDTELQVELIPSLDGTRLEVTHGGWAEGPEAEAARELQHGAWSSALERLRVQLARQGASGRS